MALIAGKGGPSIPKTRIDGPPAKGLTAQGVRRGNFLKGEKVTKGFEKAEMAGSEKGPIQAHKNNRQGADST